MAEFAVILPVFVMLLFAIIQFGIAFNRSQAVHGAAREGARVASVQGTQTEACNRAIAALGDIAFVATPTCSWSGGCAANQDVVTVTVQAQTNLNIPFWPGSGNVDLVGVGEFRCENQRRAANANAVWLRQCLPSCWLRCWVWLRW
ncbi:MAG: pilus assembly protein [Acidimicrobiales bacterium]